MADVERAYRTGIHPFHAFLVSGALVSFLGAVLADVTYARSYHIQWSNFASWLVVAGLVFGGIALGCLVVDFFRRGRGAGRYLLHALVLLAAWIVGLFDAFAHAKDAWAMMPEGLVLSIVATLLAAIALWLGATADRIGGAP